MDLNLSDIHCADQLVPILSATVAADQNAVAKASAFLDEAAKADLVKFLRMLADVLRCPGNTAVARMAAGLYLKNQLTAKDERLKMACRQRWLSFPEADRNYIKTSIMSAVGTELMRPSAAAQCIAYIAVAEIPAGLWPDLISTLTHNFNANSSTDLVKEATLETIGYICQEIDGEVLREKTDFADKILTVIVQGMHMGQTDSVRFAAANAMLNSLQFTRKNFEHTQERNEIMKVICEATQSKNTKIQVVGLQCLVNIMSLYYQHMEEYMGQALFPITLNALKSDVDEVVLQGIEFWSNVCDEEVDLAIEASEFSEMGRPPMNTSRFYAKGALPHVLPVLLPILMRQEEGDADDEWNPCKATGVCLSLFAHCCEDDIVDAVLPFIMENIHCADWRRRDAAVMAFGSILEGPDPDKLRPLAENAMPVLVQLLSDTNVVIRDTTGWTIGRICEILPDVALAPNHLHTLLEVMATNLFAEPRVAANVCWALSSLNEAAFESCEDEKEPATYALSPYFEGIVQKLLEVTDRRDGNEHGLRAAAYEALMEMVKNSAADCYAAVQHTTLVILGRLQATIGIESGASSLGDRQQIQDVQSLLCATLQSVLRKLKQDDVRQISDSAMAALLQMFSSTATLALNGQTQDQKQSGSIQEDALMAVSVLVEALGEDFMKYMELFKPFLFLALRNTAAAAVCSSAIGVAGDICRNFQSKVLPYADELMQILLETLSDPTADKSVKPPILSVFGDLALAIGADFNKYLDVAISAAHQASLLKVDSNDYDMVEYQNELREACLEAYSGFVQGYRSAVQNTLELHEAGLAVGSVEGLDLSLARLKPHVPHIVDFILAIGVDPEANDSVLFAAIGLLGDMAVGFGLSLPIFDKDAAVQELLSRGKKSKVQRTKQMAIWAAKEVKKVKNQAMQAMEQHLHQQNQ